jgi:hypothetical protein
VNAAQAIGLVVFQLFELLATLIRVAFRVAAEVQERRVSASH